MGKQGLTPKQKELFDFLSQYIKEKGYAPTIKEMAEQTKTNISTVHWKLKELIAKGWVIHTDSKARDYVISE